MARNTEPLRSREQLVAEIERVRKALDKTKSPHLKQQYTRHMKRIKIEMAQQLFTKEAQHKMNEKIKELEEERREMEYQEWLHADEIDDTDYERETYYALGGDDYDRFRAGGINGESRKQRKIS